MLGIGVPEIIMILVIALIVFGPRKLPEVGRTLGKALGEFRKATDDLKNTIEREVRVEELRQLSPANLMAPPVETVSRSEPALPSDDLTPEAQASTPKE
ncbi:MAG TPA: Sec-independent protein translocase protein TatB [Thermoanaerobaculia bacterium]|nr:Sec-independent protein translocase protein TatB [Thermoanaerobaculia bacterium]